MLQGSVWWSQIKNGLLQSLSGKVTYKKEIGCLVHVTTTLLNVEANATDVFWH